VLRIQQSRAEAIADASRQKAWLGGAKMLFDGMGALADLPRDRREAVALLMAPQMEQFGPKLGVAWTILASNPTETEAFIDFLGRMETYSNGLSAQWLEIATGVAAFNLDKAADILAKGLEEGIWSKDAMYFAPATVAEMREGWLAEGREIGGLAGEVVEKILSGKTVSGGEIVAANQTFPDNSNNRYTETVERAFLEEDDRLLLVEPSLSNADIAAKRKEKEELSLYDPPQAFVDPVRTHPDGSPIIRAAPRGSPEAQRLMKPVELGGEGMVPATFGTITDQAGGGLAPEFQGITPTTATEIQKNAIAFNEARAEMETILEGYEPGLLDLNSRVKAAAIKGRAFLSGDFVSEEDREFATKFIVNRQNSVTAMSRMLNRLSGAAISPQEAERLKQLLPDPDKSGLEFEARLNNVINETNFSIAQVNAWQMMGGGFMQATNISRSDVRDMVRGKLAQVLDALTNDNPGVDPEVIAQKAIDITEKEFGIMQGWLGRVFPDATVSGEETL